MKFHNDWFIRDVPEVGRGMGAGHPEYPWWFGCDNSYALLGLLPVGGLSVAEDVWKGDLGDRGVRYTIDYMRRMII